MEVLVKYVVKSINLKYVLIYFLLINIIGFLAMGVDKYKAKKGYWRIPEGTLLMLTLLGGGIGTFTGMHIFRHKTKKLKFTVGIPTILITEIIIICFIVYYVHKIIG